MFFPFKNYTAVDVPTQPGVGGTTNVTIYTTTANCMISFFPIQSRMRQQGLITIRVENIYTGQQSNSHDVIIFQSEAPSLNYSDVHMNTICVPAGKNIKLDVTDSFDLLGGTLHVYELAQ